MLNSLEHIRPNCLVQCSLYIKYTGATLHNFQQTSQGTITGKKASAICFNLINLILWSQLKTHKKIDSVSTLACHSIQKLVMTTVEGLSPGLAETEKRN